MKIYLHIGTEKTGTTSIQSFLADNRDELRKHKIMYSKALGDPNNIRLSIALQNTNKIDDSRIHSKITTKESILNFEKELKQNLKEEIIAEKPDILIISSEHLSSRMNEQEEVDRLKDFLSEFSDDISVVLYLRRQDKFFESLYSTAIKKGNILDFSFPEKGHERQDFHYNKMLKLWENTFGIENIKVNLFEKDKLYQKDVVSDFIHILKLPVTYQRGNEKRENLSFGRKKLSFLKEFNTVVPEIIKHRANPLRGNIEELLEKIEIQDKPVKMSSAEKIEFVKRFTDGNQAIAKRYFDGEDIFGTVLLDDKEKVDIKITAPEAIELFSNIWSEKQKECNDRLFTIRTLEIELELAKENNDKALKLAENFLLQYPNHPRTNYLYARVLYAKKKFEDAKVYCKIAYKLNPDNKDIFAFLNLINDK